MTGPVHTNTSPRVDHVKVSPLSVHIGAEIHGVDLSKPLRVEEVQTIRSALLRWGVVFFRDQVLDHKQHIRFARRFGDPTPGHVVYGGDDTFPEIYAVSKHRAAVSARPTVLRPWTDWHTDITAAVNPPFASILRAVVVPPFGGDTMWSSMVAAYQGLSPVMAEFLTTLRAVHSFTESGIGELAGDNDNSVDDTNLVAEHPMVIVHPETSQRVLYANPDFTKSVVGLTPGESHALLTMLREHCIRNEYTVRFRWQKGSIAFWDNRSTAHMAIRDIYDTDFDRQFYRITLNGDTPVGVDGQPSRRISGAPIEAIKQ